VDAVWREFSGIVVMLCLSAVAGLILVYALIGRALRPLQALSDAFIHVGAGDYGGRVPTAGPTELLRLQTGFNSMVEQLTHMSERNRHLTDQLLTLQDEERAEIARDLHDEFGPHLFAVNMDAEMIVQLCAGGSQETVVRQARSIQGAVGHMQRQVRDLLLRLRPTPVTELGFRAAVDLVRFWTARRPEIAFDLDLDESAPLKESLKDVAYRVIQEGVNNAVRHGRPAWIRIQVGPSPPDTLAVAVLDDGSPLGGSPGPGGLGLIGMRERVAASGGRLTFGPRRDGGWMVAARLPLEAQEAGGEVFTVQV
jgi:two-component system sensor histidine kinase UhpB